TVNDALVGKYTPEEWRSRAYAVRYFVGFTAAGASVGLVAWLYERGGFVTMLQGFAGLCLFVIAAALILPREGMAKPGVWIFREQHEEVGVVGGSDLVRVRTGSTRRCIQEREMRRGHSKGLDRPALRERADRSY